VAGSGVPRLSRLLCALGVTAVALGGVGRYLTRGLFDADVFASRAASSLSDPRVSAFVAAEISDAAIRQRPDLIAARPLLVGASEGLVSSEACRALARSAARSVHRGLLSEGGRDVLLSIPDVGILLQSALASANPQLAAKVPKRVSELGVSLEKTRAGQMAVAAAQAGRRLRRVSWSLLVLGFLLLLAGILRSPSRREAVRFVGGAFVVASLVLLVLHPIGRWAVASRAEPAFRPLVAGLWDAFMAGWRQGALALAGVGVVLAAAATSLLERMDARRAVEAAWRWIESPPGGTRTRVLRALLALAVGLAGLWWPEPFLAMLALAFAALLAFEGLRELFRLALGALPAKAEGPEAEVRSRPFLRAVLVGALAAALLLGGAAVLTRSTASQEVAGASGACNGQEALCDRPLDAVVFPTAHNAMSGADITDWMFPNQERGVPGLLEDGIRGLLIDVHYGFPVGNWVKTDIDGEIGSKDRFEKAVGKEGIAAAMRIRDRLEGQPAGPRGAYLCHGFCELGSQPLVEVLREVRDFLVRRPQEVLVMVIEDYVPTADLEAAFTESGLADFVYRSPVGPPWPTLGQMIERGERVLVLGESGRPGIAWYHPAFTVVQETPYAFHRPEDMSCRANRGGTSGPLFQVNHWIETVPAPRPTNAALVNSYDFLFARAERCRRERGRLPNLLAVDFAGTGDLLKVVAALNAEETREARR
jgi:hypothetical protein